MLVVNVVNVGDDDDDSSISAQEEEEEESPALMRYRVARRLECPVV